MNTRENIMTDNQPLEQNAAEQPQLLLPILKDAEWKFSNNTVSRKLVADMESPYMPWLSFGYDHPTAFEFLRAGESAFDASRNLTIIERRAVENLRARPHQWTRSDFNLGIFRKLSLLICEGDFFSAEQMLDVEFMRQAQQALRTTMLAVGIPCRGNLMVMNGNSSNELLGRFSAVVAMQYRRAESAQITPMVFMMQDGVIVGVVSGNEEVGRLTEEEEAQAQAEDDEISVSAVRAQKPEHDGFTLFVLVVCPNVSKLDAVLRNAFLKSYQEVQGEAEFSGAIQLRVMEPADSPEVRQAIAAADVFIQQFMRDLSLSIKSGNPVTCEISVGLEGLGNNSDDKHTDGRS
jgi:hypothetical protein